MDTAPLLPGHFLSDIFCYLTEEDTCNPARSLKAGVWRARVLLGSVLARLLFCFKSNES